MTSGIKLSFHPIPSLCECLDPDCHEITWNGKKYACGHNTIGKKRPRTEEHTRKQSLSNTKTFLIKPDGSKEIYPHIPTICYCMRPSCYEICWKGNYKKGHGSVSSYHPSFGMLGKTQSDKVKNKARIRMKGNTYRKKGIKPVAGFKKGHKIHLGKKATPQSKKNMSDGQKEYHKKNPDALKRMLSFNSPNKSELQLLSILNNLYPNEWKFVGNGSFVINGKCPDFINCNGKKLIIELFGERWHDKDEEEPRKEIFKQYGYETLIIWAKELRHLEILINKLNLFMENK